MGIENVDAKTPQDAIYAFCTHLAALLEMPQLRDTSKVVVIPESNLGNEGANLELNMSNIISPTGSAGAMMSEYIDTDNRGIVRLARNLHRRLAFLKGVDRPGRVGVWTTPKTKKEMGDALATRLGSGRVAFSHNLVCVASGPQFSANLAKEELVRQLKAYTRKPILDQNGEVRGYRYSGKGAGPDDLVMALQVMNLYYRYWVDAPTRRGEAPL